MPVQQSKLVLGYRTGTSFDSEDYYPLLMYNGILGGFPHSKLFVNVREKASLAYYVYSRLERLKGLMVIAAGIEAGEYQKALGIIEKQVEAMARGEISPAEMENTRRSLINALRVQEDSPYPLINAHLEGSIGGPHRDCRRDGPRHREGHAGGDRPGGPKSPTGYRLLAAGRRRRRGVGMSISWDILKSPELEERACRCLIEPGLEVYVLVKKGYRKKYAIFSTRFGSIDSRFQVEGSDQVIDVPDGGGPFPGAQAL